jgi:exosortase H (IPTLxxWG-CTERM-specific)
LAIFLSVLLGGFTLLSWNPINDHVIEPFTGAIARASGAILAAIGQGTEMDGTIIRSPRFAVNIRNGCNGVEAMIIYFAAVLAFPATWRSRLLGLLVGFAVIQLVNLIRVVALFLTGVYFPRLFDSSHTVVWQTIVILSAVVLWLVWANRFAASRPEASTAG